MRMGVHEARNGADIVALPPRFVPVGVTGLVLTDFRNYPAARLDLAAGPVVLTGPNGAGKTNLLEAVSVLSPGHGLRNARLGDFDRRRADDQPDAAGWAVAATIETRRGPVKIGTGRDPAGGEPRAVRLARTD